jgi:hypothetical protein
VLASDELPLTQEFLALGSGCKRELDNRCAAAGAAHRLPTRLHHRVGSRRIGAGRLRGPRRYARPIRGTPARTGRGYVIRPCACTGRVSLAAFKFRPTPCCSGGMPWRHVAWALAAARLVSRDYRRRSFLRCSGAPYLRLQVQRSSRCQLGGRRRCKLRSWTNPAHHSPLLVAIDLRQ